MMHGTDSQRAFGLRALGLLAVLLAALLLSACGLGQDQAAQERENTSTSPDVNVPLEEQATMEWPDTTMNDILSDPAAYQGRDVKIRGYITELVGQEAMLFGDSSLDSENDMLVLLSDERVVTEDTAQHLIATVRQFDERLAQEYGIAQEDDTVARFANQPVLVAQLIWPVAGTGVADVSITDIVEDPSAFHGTDVHVSATIREALSDSIFRVARTEGPDAEDIMVVVTDGQSHNDLREEHQVQIAGTVYTVVDADIQTYAGVAIPSDLLVEYKNQPIIVATSISTDTL